MLFSGRIEGSSLHLRLHGILPMLILVAGLSLPLVALPRTVRVGVFPAAPLVSVEAGKPQGLFIDLLEYFSRELNWKLVYVEDSWGSLLAQLEKGEVDLLPAVSFTTARLAKYDFSRNPVFVDSGVIFTSSKVTLHTIFDLQGKKVAALRDSVFTTGFLDYIKSFGVSCELVLTNDNRSVMAEIASGRVDAGVCIYSLGNALAPEYGLSITPISFSPLALEFAVPKGRNADLLADIDRLMAVMVGDPHSFYSRTYHKWTAPKAETEFPAWLFWGLLGLLGLGLFLGSWTYILRRQVRTKTSHLEVEIAERRLAQAELSKTVGEKEALIRELYHRTTNTMQVIRAMLFLQAAELPDNPGLQHLVRSTEARIDAIALVHELLYKSQDLSRVSMATYVRELSAHIFGLLNVSPALIKLDIEIGEDSFLLDTAIPLGLVLNELLSNSLRHAFPEKRRGRIFINLSRLAEGRHYLAYSDDGIGVPEGFDFQNQAGLGLKLIKVIGEQQLLGRVEFRSKDGLTCEIEVSTGLYEARV